MSELLKLFALLPFYLIGAIPSGFLLARLQGVNITKEGSGNVGATNVTRVLGKKFGAMTLLIDVAKGFIAALLASILTDSTSFIALASLAAVCGHCISIPKILPGGKGVATTLGVGLYLEPYAAVISVIIFTFVFFSLRIVSIASLLAVAAAPVSAYFLGASDSITTALAVIVAIVTYKHRSNIQRLIEGTEKQPVVNKL